MPARTTTRSRVGSASQTVIGSTGTLRVLATAAEAGVAVDGATGESTNTTLEITTGGSIASTAWTVT